MNIITGLVLVAFLWGIAVGCLIMVLIDDY